MEQDFTIYIVDDAEAPRRILEVALSPNHTVETFSTAEDCWDRASTALPDLFLLDVGLPGMNGFELCQQLRQIPETEHIPVIFISALDDLESRLEGYKVGGTDFVVKPYKIAEVKHKVDVARRARHGTHQLHQRIEEANRMSFSFLASLGENSALLNFLRELNQGRTYQDVGHAFLRLLEAYDLHGAVQIRAGGSEHTYSPSKPDAPLEEAVIRKIRQMGRIVEFKTHSAYNYDYATILVVNMPIHDADLCGRVRDNLTIAAESIDAKSQAIEAIESFKQLQQAQSIAQKQRTRTSISTILEELRATIDTFNTRYELARQKGTALSVHLQSDLLGSFAYLGLTANQESNILALVNEKTDHLISLYDFSSEMENTLKTLSQRLTTMLLQEDNRQ